MRQNLIECSWQCSWQMLVQLINRCAAGLDAEYSPRTPSGCQPPAPRPPPAGTAHPPLHAPAHVCTLFRGQCLSALAHFRASNCCSSHVVLHASGEQPWMQRQHGQARTARWL